MIRVNLNKDIDKLTYMSCELDDDNKVKCYKVFCIGHDEMMCEDCIFTDEEGILTTNSISLESLYQEGRVE